MSVRRAGIALLVAVALIVIGAFLWVAMEDGVGPFHAYGDSAAPPYAPAPYAPPTLGGKPVIGSNPSGAPSQPGTPGFVAGACNHAVVNKPQGPGRSGLTHQHAAVIRVWSAVPIPQIAVAAPTARLWVQEWCAARAVSWTVTVWGPGPYAQVFIGSAVGSPATCSITIDGVVRTARSTPRGGGVQFCRA